MPEVADRTIISERQLFMVSLKLLYEFVTKNAFIDIVAPVAFEMANPFMSIVELDWISVVSLTMNLKLIATGESNSTADRFKRIEIKMNTILMVFPLVKCYSLSLMIK